MEVSPSHRDACDGLFIYIYLIPTQHWRRGYSLFFLSQLGIDPSDASIRHTAVLAKVAEWARNNNNNDQSDSLQFDVAVFIRR